MTYDMQKTQRLSGWNLRGLKQSQMDAAWNKARTIICFLKLSQRTRPIQLEFISFEAKQLVAAWNKAKTKPNTQLGIGQAPQTAEKKSNVHSLTAPMSWRVEQKTWSERQSGFAVSLRILRRTFFTWAASKTGDVGMRGLGVGASDRMCPRKPSHTLHFEWGPFVLNWKSMDHN